MLLTVSYRRLSANNHHKAIRWYNAFSLTVYLVQNCRNFAIKLCCQWRKPRNKLHFPSIWQNTLVINTLFWRQCCIITLSERKLLPARKITCLSRSHLLHSPIKQHKEITSWSSFCVFNGIYCFWNNPVHKLQRKYNEELSTKAQS